MLCLSCALVSAVRAQGLQRARQVVLEHQFRAASEQVTVVLRRNAVYQAELLGPGTPTFEPLNHARAAFVLPTGDTTAQLRRFELHVFVNGPHVVRISDLTTGDSVVLVLYADTLETARIARNRDRAASLGLSVAAGIHSGYRLDPTGGNDPRGGGDVEACALLEAGNRFGTCVGYAKQAFPDAQYSASWIFLEERVGLISRQWLGASMTDLSAMLRYSKGLSIGPRNLSPDMLGLGLLVTQHFSSEGLRRGWRAFLSWQHGRLGNAPETEFLDTERLTLGLIWSP